MSNNKDVLGQIMKSKDQVVMQQVPLDGSGGHEDDKSYSKYAEGNPSGGCAITFLGVNWYHEVDRFKLELLHVITCSKNLPPTKCSLGFIRVFTIKVKAFFHDLCLTTLTWDETLQGSYRKS